MSCPLPGSVESSRAVLGFDCLTRLDAATCALFFSSGYRFAVRYLSRSHFVPDDTDGAGSMSRAEAETILGSGLALMPVQKAKRNMQASAIYGRAVGVAAAANASDLGFPPGVTVWCDVEAVALTESTEDVIAYCNAWWSEVDAAGFVPGLYVGPNSRLTTEVLYSRLKFTGYWKSASKVGNVDTRGYQMLQSLSMDLNGIRVDSNIAAVDSRGGRPQWLAPE
jgi:hypothetical protein